MLTSMLVVLTGNSLPLGYLELIEVSMWFFFVVLSSFLGIRDFM